MADKSSEHASAPRPTGWEAASRVLDRRTVAHHEAGHAVAFEIGVQGTTHGGTVPWEYIRIFHPASSDDSNLVGGTKSTANLAPVHEAAQWMAGLAAEALLRDRAPELTEQIIAGHLVDSWLPLDGSNDRQNAIYSVCDLIPNGTIFLEAALDDETLPPPFRDGLIAATLEALRLLRAQEARWREIAARLLATPPTPATDPEFGEGLESRITWDDMKRDHE